MTTSTSSDSPTYASANKNYFNDLALSFYDHPKIRELAKRSAQAIRQHYPFDEDSTVVMDFACGTGLMSRELAPYAKSIVGVDISQSVVDHYNQTVSDQGILPEEMKAVCTELKGKDEELDGLKFDVITCGSSYHHFESIDDVTRTLAFFLKPGGVLMVVDIFKTNADSEPSIFPDHVHHIVAHKAGFTEDDIEAAFSSAGLVSFYMEPVIPVRKQQLFLAKGTKPLLVAQQPEFS